LADLGHRVSRTTIANVLKEHGMDPATKRRRRTSWSTFIKAHWPNVAALDFTTVEVWTKGGLMTYYVLFVMDLATRRVTCAGITPHPETTWMLQIGRNLTDVVSGFLRGKRYLLMDRDSSFSAAFRGLLEGAGVESIRLPAQSPNCNAYLERFHGSFKSEAADRMIFLGEDHLRRVVGEYLEYYHGERNHQGLDGRIIEPRPEVGAALGKVRRRQRLGGMLNYYYRDAA
jgi:putative transposase